MKRPGKLSAYIALLAGWWLLWLGVSQTPWNVAIAPSFMGLTHFAVLLISFVAGAAFVEVAFRASAPTGKRPTSHAEKAVPRIRWLIYGLAISSSLLLLVSLHLAGAFATDFVEYFSRLRMGSGPDGSLTGIKLLDTLTKVFAFPTSYALLLLVLASGVRLLRPVLAICVLNFVCFSYLWQVNYPFIHLFWLAFFYVVGRYVDGAGVDRRTFVGLSIVLLLLVLSAMNRFGSEDSQLMGAVQHYLIGYHLIGFSFYDYHLADPNSILHVHSFGRSSLGFLEQLLEHAAKLFGGGYLAASSENSTFNDTAVSIGAGNAIEFNAFGTLAFTFYRDFGIVGVFIGGFAYGAALAYGLLNRHRNWIAMGIFYLLAPAWMVGMMVSPIEQTYFWFCLVSLAMIALASRLRNAATAPHARRQDPSPGPQSALSPKR